MTLCSLILLEYLPDSASKVVKSILQSELAYQINTFKLVEYFLICCLGRAVFVQVCTSVHACAAAHMCMSMRRAEDNCGSQFSPPTTGSQDWDIRLGWQ